MAMTVGDFFIDRLYQWGVRRIYGYPGDGINGVFGALQRAEGKIEFIQVRHEEMAAFMASAHAKFTGELGVCIATSGRAPRTSSLDFTTRGSTTCRCWPLPANRRGWR
jgi:pyruvate dehydrogenase (quinone)